MEKHSKRVEVWKHTQSLNQLYFKDPKKSIKYKLKDFENLNRNDFETTELKVVNMDTIDCAYEHRDLNPLLLNMADDSIPGGFVGQGSAAQEEDIFRRSNIELTLLYKPEFYPIFHSDAVYSPEVTVFRENQFNNFKLVKEPWNLSIISSPGLRHPQLENDRLRLKDRQLLIDKIKNIINIAYKHEHKVLILSAHGCGAWKSPPEEVASIYKEVLNEYKGLKVYFAILGVNYEIFKAVVED